MNHPSLLTRVQFQAIFLTPFAIILLLFSFFAGCAKQEEPKAAKPEVTIENLQTAYAKAVKYGEMYKKFLAQAEKEKNTNVVRLFQAVVHSESVHAARHAELLKKQGVEPVNPQPEPVTVGTTIQTLKMAVNTEEIEFQSMYPNLLRSAMQENFTEAAEQFGRCRDGDARQYDLLKDAHERGGKIQKVVYTVCPVCGYIATSDTTLECPVCKTKKNMFQNI
jgi:rubrerythrin